MYRDISKFTINKDRTIHEALSKLNGLSGSQTLFVLNESDQLVGTVTDGDIRRNLLKGVTIDQLVEVIMFTNFRYTKENYVLKEQLTEYKNSNISQIPLLDDNNRIIKLIDVQKIKSFLPCDVVMMAGGRGERLKPLTNHVPKPLLKIGNRSILERNIDRLTKFGIKNLYIIVNYLGEQIKNEIGNGIIKGVDIQYIDEDEPMGTIGSVSSINNFKNNTILVMNSDLLTNIDFEDFYINFISENAAMSVASIPYKVNIPYAVVEKEGNRIQSFVEKPTYTYFSNAGIYLIKKEMLNLIPKSELFNATDLMQVLIDQNQKVIDFPILGYWLDIGRHDDFDKAQKDVEKIDF